MSDSQRTLKTPVTVSGVGLHTGQSVTMTISPAPANTGVVFVRTDLPTRPMIPAAPKYAVDTAVGMRRTIIAKDGVDVQTVEHFMAALWGLGVDNAYAEVSGPELPGLDGSAAPFVHLVGSAGVVEQAVPRKYFTVREPIVLTEDDSMLAVFPDKTFSVSYTLDYHHPQLKTQFASFTPNGKPFAEAIAPARTFCLYEEAEALRARGFGLGASYENTLVVGPQGVMHNTLRFDDEFVRHKILDLIGDLYLLGAHLRGHVVAIKSGHSLNMKLIHKLDQAMELWLSGALKAVTGEVMVGPQLDSIQIQKILPHRYPFLLVDRIVSFSETKIVGLKCVTVNDYFFRGHFPNRPVMPGVLMVEAMAQVAGVLMLNKPDNRGKLAYFMSVDKVKFRKPVVPGDQLIIEMELAKLRSRIGQFLGKVYVDGKVVCEGELMFAIADE